MCLAACAVPAPMLRANHGAHADCQANQRRGLEETNYAGEANRRGDWLLAKQRDVEQVEQIDGNTAMRPIAPVPAMTIT
jgi:hypothetical protein